MLLACELSLLRPPAAASDSDASSLAALEEEASLDDAGPLEADLPEAGVSERTGVVLGVPLGVWRGEVKGVQRGVTK